MMPSATHVLIKIQDTRHQYLDCSVAKNYWKMVKKITQRITGFNLITNASSILFNNPWVSNKTDRQFITEIVLDTKYTIYRNCLDM